MDKMLQCNHLSARMCGARGHRIQKVGSNFTGSDEGRFSGDEPGEPEAGSPGICAKRCQPFFAGGFALAGGFAAARGGREPSGFRTTKSSLRSTPLDAAESFGAFKSRTWSPNV